MVNYGIYHFTYIAKGGKSVCIIATTGTRIKQFYDRAKLHATHITPINRTTQFGISSDSTLYPIDLNITRGED